MNIEIKVTVPKKLLQSINIQDALAKKQLDTTVPELTELFEGTVHGWSDPPRFGYDQTKNSTEVGVYVGPKGEFGGGNKPYNVYRMVSLGTPRHPIPKRPFTRKWLRFREGYIAATSPGSLTSSSPRYTGEWRLARQVNHPGIKSPRSFNVHIAKKYQSKFEDDMQEAVNYIFNSKWG